MKQVTVIGVVHQLLTAKIIQPDIKFVQSTWNEKAEKKVFIYNQKPAVYSDLNLLGLEVVLLC